MGGTLQLSAKIFNINGEELSGKVITWSSSEEAVVTVDATGLVTAIKKGVGEITASSEKTKSQPIGLEIGDTQKVASFTDADPGGYIAEGTATLKRDESGQLILEFSSDFKTSFALGTFIYLSNSRSGPETKANGMEIKQIRSNIQNF